MRSHETFAEIKPLEKFLHLQFFQAESVKKIEIIHILLVQNCFVSHANSSVWAQLGRIHLKMNNVQQAKDAFERAVAYEKVC